ncbi:tetratricopeptide repeat protein [Synechococcus sp. M16.1]|uniref:tetratricopeptide repeat-containing sulfotransferase family protein n=1 Tax=Synechococcus sp. M16.1 TaxID=1442553 RepID=UPI00164946C1|nr:tetratricopeptide repeat protein [Synechococcus sp. M16.1]QNJ12307.1 TPR repeat-containing protein [Synechococcus sp. M16.1]
MMAGFGNSNPNTKKQKIPKNGPQLLEAAIGAHKTGDITKAEALYLNAINSGFHHEIAFSNLGIIYKNTGRKEKALTIYKRAVAKNPNFADAYTNLGNLYKDLGNLDQALTSTLKSLELNPDNPTALINLGSIYKDLGNLDRALASTLKSLELNPDNPSALMNLGGIYKNLGNLDQALTSTLKSLELNPDNPSAHMNLGGIYKDLGNLDQALASTIKSLELKPDNHNAHMNLGWIYKDLGNLDQALASTLKSLELKPEGSEALCKLGLIKMALGQTKEAKRDLLNSIKCNEQECEAHHALSTLLETTEEAEELIEIMKSVKTSVLTPLKRAFAEFAQSNCFHKIKNHDQASKHLVLANKYKLITSPSNADSLLEKIALSVSQIESTKTTNRNANSGKGRIFIVGMPRSGSTLLETILSMNPENKDLGESRSLEKAIAKAKQQQQSCNSNHQNIDEYYSKLEPINNTQHKYTTDKQLYNFIHINWIANHMPAAKIIHCRRNPMDNILSMHRSNLMAGNNFTANLEDSAKVLVAHEKAMQIQKNRYPKKIFTFDYDQFVNAPEDNLRKLLGWLDLEFDNNYLHPEKSTRIVNTASVMQARKPISNKSVGGWKNYETLLKPAFKIIQESGVKIG